MWKGVTCLTFCCTEIVLLLPLITWCFCALYLDMRKALSRDVEKKSIIPLKRPVTPDELEYD